MKVYSVEIASTGALDDGFIDPKTTQDYSDFNAEAGEVADYESKAKGWIRWRNLIEKLSEMHVINDVMDIEIPGASSLVAPTSIKFFLTYDGEPSVRLADDSILYGEDAIKEMVSFVLTHDYDMLAMVWNPTVVKQGEKDLMPKGAEFKFVKAPKLFSGVAAKNAVTVKTFDVPNPTDVSLKLSVTPPPPQSKVIINGVETTEYRGNIGDEITWSASADHFISQNGELELEQDTEINVELVEVPGTVIINPTPSDAIVKINNMERKSYTGRYGENVTWEVSKVGYKPKSGSLTITEDEVTIPVELEITRVSLTINPTPADAVVTIDGKTQKTITVDYGTEVSYSVAKIGYDTKSAKITLVENTNLDIELSQTVVVLTINPTPSDATVIIAGVEQKNYTGVYGDIVDWEVSAAGYTSKSGSETLTENKTVDVALEKVQVTVSINATPSDATVTLNGEERNTITVDYGTKVDWVVSKTGYVSQNGSITPTENITKDVALVLEKHTFSIVATPSDATVIINGEERSTFTADYGTEINWSVGKEGYVSKEGTYILTADKEEVVALDKQQITITVAATPEDATVKLNGAVRKSVTVDYGTEVSYEVSKTGYVSKSGTVSAINTETITIELVKQKVTLTIAPTPEDAVVKINGIEQKTITVDYGTEVTYEVSKTGYVSKTATISVVNTETLYVSLSNEQVTITITPTPEDATVKLNGVVQKSITVDYGTQVTYEVSKTGYVSKSGNIIADETQTLPVELVKQQVTLTIVPTPEDATVKLNGVVQKSVTVDYGTEVTYEVSKTGYDTKTDKVVVNETKSLPITLSKTQVTLTITPTPSNATVIINDVERKSITVDYGTKVTYAVSATGYVSKSGEETVIANKTLPVALVKQQVTVTIVPTPADATVKIDGEVKSEVTVDYGTEISYEVSKTGYVSKSGTETVTATKTLTVVLEVQKVTFAITPTPTDATVTINGTAQKSVSVDYGSEVSWEVSKPGYTTRNGTEVVNKDTTIAIELVIKQFTFTITPTPADATVTINDVVQSSLTADYGTAITWSVAKNGFKAQNGSLTLTEDTTLPVTLVGSAAIKQIETADGNTTFVLYDNGELYGCGDNKYGQQGDGTTNTVKTFTKRADGVKDVDCSDDTTFYLTTTGELYGCGNNQYGQQGDGTTANVGTFTKRAENVEKIYISRISTFYLTTTGELYGCGYNSDGQQGDGTTTKVKTFTKRADGVKDASCSSNTTFYLTTTGELYGCGYNGHGQQGDGTTTNVGTFTKRAENVEKIYSSGFESFYITTTGELYGCGYNEFGQQGDGTTTAVKRFTKRADGVKDVVCSNDTTFYLTTTGELYGCGNNQYGQQGDGTTTNVGTFTKRAENVEKIYISRFSTFYLTTTGELYGCGDNSDGQQGDGTTNAVKTFTKRADGVKDASCSSKTTFYLTTTGELYGCGGNVRGQQGDGTTTEVRTFTKKVVK